MRGYEQGENEKPFLGPPIPTETVLQKLELRSNKQSLSSRAWLNCLSLTMCVWARCYKVFQKVLRQILEKNVLILGVHGANSEWQVRREQLRICSVIKHSCHYRHVSLHAQDLGNLQARNCFGRVLVLFCPLVGWHKCARVLHRDAALDAGEAPLNFEGLQVFGCASCLPTRRAAYTGKAPKRRIRIKCPWIPGGCAGCSNY
jgi:hypothetical protein